MRILVVGGGGREHALCQALGSHELHAAPGNPGIAGVAACHPVAVDDLDGQVALAHALAVELVVIGPELPLVLGLADRLRAEGFKVFGPSAAAARIEGSKAFAKELMGAAGIPTARFRACGTLPEAVVAIDELGGACVIKADGLAAGKGVSVCGSRDEAVAAAAACFGGAFGEAGASVVVEELMTGPEVSLLALCAGRRAYPLAPAQDFKRIFDGDRGPNTGGMGAYSPLPALSDADVDELVRTVHEPLLAELARRGTPFTGCLYAGLMLTPEGVRVIEYNVRFGDPETQALVARIDGDLAPALLEPQPVRMREGAAITVVLAAPGYPQVTRTGQAITGIERAEAIDGVTVQHAGTATTDGRLVVAGGRVLGVTARGRSLAEARERVYRGVDLIEFDGKQARTDIALEAARV